MSAREELAAAVERMLDTLDGSPKTKAFIETRYPGLWHDIGGVRDALRGVRPVVTDAAVEAAVRAYCESQGLIYDLISPYQGYLLNGYMRAALEAALPHLSGGGEVVDVEALRALVERGVGTDLNPTVGPHVAYGWWRDYLRRLDATWRSRVAAALGGEQ